MNPRTKPKGLWWIVAALLMIPLGIPGIIIWILTKRRGRT
jgi:hypothetical protein